MHLRTVAGIATEADKMYMNLLKIVPLTSKDITC